MDLVQVSTFIAKSPFALPVVLMIAVWYTVTLLQKKDEYIESHIREDLAKAEQREKRLQKNTEENTKLLIDIKNDVKDIEAMLLERGESFDSHEDQTSPSPTSDNSNMRSPRRKLPK